MSKTLLVDCGCLSHRAKHTTALRIPNTGVIYGFFRELLEVVKSVGPIHNIAFCWDSKKSIRRKKVQTYGRKKAPEEITEFDENCFKQFSMLRCNIIPKLFNNSFLITGYEADDLIASVLKNNQNNGKYVTVAQDSDLYQLLNYTDLYDPRKKTLLTKKRFQQLYKLSNPNQWALVKSIGGCKSDNVKGVKGVAEKTAIKYLKGNCSTPIVEKIERHMQTQKYRIDKWLVELPLKGTPKLLLDDYKPPKITKFMTFLDRYKIRTFKLKDWIDAFGMV